MHTCPNALKEEKLSLHAGLKPTLKLQHKIRQRLQECLHRGAARITAVGFLPYISINERTE